jgi:hypothetical protein
MGISETTVARMFALVDEEITKQLNQKMNKYIEYVSKRYDIPMRLLLQDLGNIDNLIIPESPSGSRGDGLCLGMRTGNQRCKLKGRFGGYCRWHQDQKKDKIFSRSNSNLDMICRPAVEHTHTLPPLYMKGCPACDGVKKVPSQQKLLIDM